MSTNLCGCTTVIDGRCKHCGKIWPVVIKQTLAYGEPYPDNLSPGDLLPGKTAIMCGRCGGNRNCVPYWGSCCCSEEERKEWDLKCLTSDDLLQAPPNPAENRVRVLEGILEFIINECEHGKDKRIAAAINKVYPEAKKKRIGV